MFIRITSAVVGVIPLGKQITASQIKFTGRNKAREAGVAGKLEPLRNSSGGSSGGSSSSSSFLTVPHTRVSARSEELADAWASRCAPHVLQRQPIRIDECLISAM